MTRERYAIYIWTRDKRELRVHGGLEKTRAYALAKYMHHIRTDRRVRFYAAPDSKRCRSTLPPALALLVALVLAALNPAHAEPLTEVHAARESCPASSTWKNEHTRQARVLSVNRTPDVTCKTITHVTEGESTYTRITACDDKSWPYLQVEYYVP